MLNCLVMIFLPLGVSNLGNRYMLWLNEEFNEYNECVGVLIILLNVWWYDIMQEIWISLPLRAWNLGNIYMLRLQEDLMNTMSQ